MDRITITSQDGKWETTEVLVNGKKANNVDSIMLMGRKAWSYKGQDEGDIEVPSHFTFMMTSSVKKGEDEEQTTRLEINNSAEVGEAFLDEGATDGIQTPELEGTPGDGTGTTEGSRTEEVEERETESSEEAKTKKSRGSRVLGV